MHHAAVGSFQALALQVKHSRVCDPGDQFNNTSFPDEWYHIYYLNDPYYQFNSGLALLLLEMSGQDSTEELCSSIPDQYGNETSSEYGEYIGTVEDIVNSFFSMLDNADQCERVLHVIEEDDEEAFYNSTGFRSVRDLCGFVTDAYAGDADLSELNIIDLLTSSSSESSYSSWGSNGQFWWETPIADFKSLMAIFGKVLRSDTLIEGISITCEQIGEGLDQMLDFNFLGLCQALESNKLKQFIRTCKDDESPSWYYDYEYWEEYWDDYWEAYWFTEYQLQVVQNMLRSGLEQSSLPIYDPFETCEEVADILQSSMDSFIENFYKPVATGAFRSLSLHLRNTICGDWEDRGWSVSSMVWLEENNYSRFQDTLAQVLMSMGGHESRENLCTAIPAHYWDEWNYYTSSDIRQDVYDDHITNVVDTFFSMLDNADECENVLNILDEADGIDFYDITGFRNAGDMCDFIINAFEGDVDIGELDILSNFTVARDTNSPWPFAVPDRPGWVTPFTDLRYLIAVFGKTFQLDTLIDGLATACQYLGGPLGVALDKEDAFNQLCQAYGLEDSEPDLEIDSQLMCEHILVPIIYGPDYPINLRPIDTDKMRRFS